MFIQVFARESNASLSSYSVKRENH